VTATRTVQITGRVVYDTVPDILTRVQQDLATQQIEAIDLSGVDTIDSSAIALLFACLRQQPGLRIRGVPANLISLVELYGVSDLLPS
jgi:phospholipid transport system transporter-binding protein